MSDVDFQNGFLCGIAVKGVPGGGTGAHKCIEIFAFGQHSSVVEIEEKDIIITSFEGLKEE